MSRCRVVATSQNHRHHAWQVAVLAHSYQLHHPSLAPLVIMVSTEPGDGLHPDFALAAQAGAELRTCADLEGVGGRPYSARNTVAALLDYRPGEEELVVLIDQDKIFTGPVDFGNVGAGPGVVTMDRHPGMEVITARLFVDLKQAAARVGLDWRHLGAYVWGGTPHVLHVQDVHRFAKVWLEMIEPFWLDKEGFMPWVASMWGAVLATKRLEMRLVLTELAVSNTQYYSPSNSARIVHYCGSDRIFAKDDYKGREAEVWRVKPVGDGSISDRVRKAMHEAALFYGRA